MAKKRFHWKSCSMDRARFYYKKESTPKRVRDRRANWEKRKNLGETRRKHPQKSILLSSATDWLYSVCYCDRNSFSMNLYKISFVSWVQKDLSLPFSIRILYFLIHLWFRCRQLSESNCFNQKEMSTAGPINLFVCDSYLYLLCLRVIVKMLRILKAIYECLFLKWTRTPWPISGCHRPCIEFFLFYGFFFFPIIKVLDR